MDGRRHMMIAHVPRPSASLRVKCAPPSVISNCGRSRAARAGLAGQGPWTIARWDTGIYVPRSAGKFTGSPSRQRRDAPQNRSSRCVKTTYALAIKSEVGFRFRSRVFLGSAVEEARRNKGRRPVANRPSISEGAHAISRRMHGQFFQRLRLWPTSCNSN